ncbi:MAG: HEAT repeat domain-containing protein [Planctomycetota bacterium]
MSPKTVLLALLAIGCSTQAFSDTVLLSRGTQVDGKIEKEFVVAEVTYVVIRVDDDLSIAIPKSRIRKSIPDEDEKLAAYAAAAKAVGDDADAHFELGKTCKGNGLDAQREYHYRRAIEINPDHPGARRALGYVPDGSDWILFTEQQRRRGLIYATGKWRVPEEYAIEKSRDEADKKSKRWLGDFKRLRTNYLKAVKLNDAQRAAEAFDALAAIDDPFAGLSFVKALESSRGKNTDPRKLRELYVKKLADFNAVATLVKTGLEEPDAHIRDLALERLQENGAPSAVATYLAILRKPGVPAQQVKQALRGLQFFPDPELWRLYVDALITEHKTVSSGGPGISTGFGSNGSSGLGFGSKKEVKIDTVQHPEAVELLRMITPDDVDFRYDKRAWRRYFADQLMRSPSDLRRDP